MNTMFCDGIKKYLSSLVLGALFFGMFPVQINYAATPVVNTTISVFKTGSEPFDGATWDGSNLTLAGLDASENNNVARLQDSITYKVEVSVNDSNIDELTSTVVLDLKQAWIEIPTGCQIDSDIVTNISTISTDKRTLFCNMGPAIEGTNRIFFPTARVIGASNNGTEITLNDDRVSASVSSIGDGSNTATDSSEDTIVTANFQINTVKEIINTATDPDTGASLYIAPTKVGEFPENRAGSIIEYIIKAQYVKGSMLADSDEVTYEEDYQIIDIYTDDNTNNDSSGTGANLSTGGRLYDWGTEASCSLIGNHGPNASVTCSQLNAVIDNIGAGGAAPDGIFDPNILIDLQNIDVRDPDNDGNLFEIQINIWFDKIDDLDSHQVCTGGGTACVNAVVNRVGTLSGSTIEGFNPISTEDVSFNNLLNYNGAGEPFPNEESYPLVTSPPGGYAAIIGFTNLFPFATQKYPDQDMAAGETIPYLMNLYDYRKIDGAVSHLCNKIDTEVFTYAGVAPPNQIASPALYSWNQNQPNNPTMSTFGGPNGTTLGDGTDLVDFYFTNHAYTADPIADQSGYLAELRTAECNDDVNGDGQINININGVETNTGVAIDWWTDALMVPPVGGGVGEEGNVTRVRQNMVYDAVFAQAQDPTHNRFALTVNHLITAKSIAASPYGTDNRLPHFMSHRRDNGDGIFNTWTHADVTYEDPNADANFSIVPAGADRMTLVPSSHSIEKYTEPRGIKVVRGGDIVDFIIEPKVYGLWDDTTINTARVYDNLPTGTTYISGSEMFSTDAGATWFDYDTYAASNPDVTVTSSPIPDAEDPINWEFGSVEVGDQLPLIRYSVQVDPARVSGTFTNISRLFSDIGIDVDGDGDPDDVQARYQLTILPEFGFDVLKVVGEKLYNPNESFEFDLVYKNLGGEDYNNGSFIDIFPYEDDGNGGVTSGLASTRDPSSTFTGSLTLTDITFSNGEVFYGTDADPSTIPQDPCSADNLPATYVPSAGELCHQTYVNNANMLPGGGTQGTGLVNWQLCTNLNDPITCGSIAPEDLTALKFETASVTANAGGQMVSLEFTPVGNLGGTSDLDSEGNVTASSSGNIYTNTFGGRISEISLVVISNDQTVTVVSGSIGDYIWYDEDADGMQDGSENGIENVTLELLNNAGVPIYVDPTTGGIVNSSYNGAVAYTTMTNGSGAYLFDNLPSGDYQVRVVESSLPNGMIQTYDSNGTGSLNISSHTLLEEMDVFGNLTGIEDNTDQDFGYTAYVDLEVDKKVDMDGDSSYEELEIIDVPGLSGNPNPTTFNYQITVNNTSNLVEGTNVILTDIIPPGVTITTSTMTPTNIAPNETFPITGSGGTGTPLTWSFPTFGTGTTYTIVLDAELSAANLTDFLNGFDSGKTLQNVAQITGMDEDDFDSIINNGTGADYGGTTAGFDPSLSEDDEDDARIGIPPAIGDRVWIDTNNDGVQDADTALEPGILGVTVNLYVDDDGTPGPSAGDTLTGTTLTGSGGIYFFTDLTAGNTYYAEFDHSSSSVVNFDSSTQNSTLNGGTDSNDSDGDPTTGYTDTYTIGSGEIYSDFDQGYVPIMSIGNRIFEDTNGNGSHDTTTGTGVSLEPGLAGIAVELRDENGDPFGTPITTTTSASGHYLFTDLIPGDYTIFVPDQSGLTNYVSSPGNPDPNNDIDQDDNGDTSTGGYITPVITLFPSGEPENETGGTGPETDYGSDNNSNLTVDFGFIPPTPPTITKSFSVDTIAPGSTSILTITLGNVNIFDINLTADLVDVLPTNTQVASTPNITTTCPDTPIAVASSTTITYPDTSTIPSGGCSINVDVTGTIDGTYTNEIGTGSLQTNVGDNPESTEDDITIVSSSLGDIVWFDLNADGVQDGNELTSTPSSIGGLTINLLSSTGAIIDTTTTSSTGYYLFEDLVPGDYSVEVILPDDYYVSAPESDGSGGDTSIDSNFNTTPTVTTSTTKTYETNTIALGLGQDRRDIDAGIYVLPKLSGMVFHDVDKNHVQGTDSVYSGGTPVNLLNSTGAIIASTITDVNGNYIFENLFPGDYYVRIARPTVYNRTSSQDLGGDDSMDYDIDSQNTTGVYTLNYGDHQEDVDAGFYYHSGGGGGGGGSSSGGSSSSSSTSSSSTSSSSSGGTTPPSIPEEEKEEEVPEVEESTDTLPEIEEELFETEYTPYPNEFTYPRLLPQTGTVEDLRAKGVKVYLNPKIDTTPPSWTRPDTTNAKQDLNYWKNEVLPYTEDRDADEYVVIPSLGVIVPTSYIPRDSSDYTDITKDGTQIKDFSLQGGKNYLSYLDAGVMHYPGTLPAGLPAGVNREYTGNTVIFGHSSYWKSNEGKYDTIFGLLPTLDEGEEIWMYTRKHTSSSTNNQKGEYELRKYKVKKSYETSPSDTQILSQEGYIKPHLTLFTCTPIGGISGRWIVQAELTEVNKLLTPEEETRLEIEAQEREVQQALEYAKFKAEDEQYGEYLSRYLRKRVRSLIERIFLNIGENNHEKLKGLLLQRLEKIEEKYADNTPKLILLEYIQMVIEEQ